MTSSLARPVVVGVDGSLSALNAVRWGAAEASRRDRPLRLVTAVDFSSTVAFGGGFGPPQDFFDQMEIDGRRWLIAAEKAALQAHPDLTVARCLRSRTTATQSLVEESEHAQLMVLGSRGLGGFAGMLVGSTAVELVARGRCPVVVVRGAEPDGEIPTTGPVVVGVDGSQASEAATALAFEEASMRCADLVAVHTWVEFFSDSAYAHGSQLGMDWKAIEDTEAGQLAERLAGWQEKYPDVTVRRIVTRDRPVRCLLEHAADAQLLVVGSRGHGQVSGMLLGSTSRALIYHAPCPLLVARPGS